MMVTDRTPKETAGHFGKHCNPYGNMKETDMEKPIIQVKINGKFLA